MHRPYSSRIALGAAVVTVIAGLLFVGVGAVAAQDPTPGAFPARAHGLKEPGGRGPKKPHKDENTADRAGREMAKATKDLGAARTDLAFAQGKMDTTLPASLLERADGLLTQANTANTASDYRKATEYAKATSEAAKGAQDLLGDTLGSALPSAAHRPAGRQPGDPPPHLAGADQATTDAWRQAHASRELANAYTDLIRLAGLARQHPAMADMTSLVQAAQMLYRDGYAQYQAGQYQSAGQLGHESHHVIQVVAHILQAEGVDIRLAPEVPVAVPAPVFP